MFLLNLVKIFDYTKHLQASCPMATGCLTSQITLTCRNMKVWADAMNKKALTKILNIIGDWVFGAKTGVGKLYYPSGSLLFYGKEVCFI